ncbi:MAG: hypothetical protein WCC85_14255, partial [Candidatus Sulfotelmatobacter sp.]
MVCLSANIDFARQGMLLGSPEATFLSRMIGRRGTHWLADTSPDSRFMLFQGSPVNAGSFYEPSGFPSGNDLTSWAAPGSLAAVFAATAASAVGVSAAIAVSVAGASAPPAAFARHSPSVYP